MISLGEFILLSLIVLSAVLATVYLNRKLKEKGYRVNNLLNVLVVLTVSTALCLVGTSVAWILKGVAFALILLYASVEDFTKREADDCLWVMILLLCITNASGLSLWSMLGGGIIAFVPTLAMTILCKNGFGGADIKLAGASGLMLGFMGGSIGYLIGLLFSFLEMCVCYGVSYVVAGRTSSGKTNLLNSLLSAVPDYKRIYTIENGARELSLIKRDVSGKIKNNVVHTLSRPSDKKESNITQEDLVVTSLRFDPDIICIGEMRDSEASSAIEASSTDHTVVTTVHGDGGRRAHRRIAFLAQKAEAKNEVGILMEQAALAFPIVVFVHKLANNARKVMEITECVVHDNGELEYRVLYRYKIKRNLYHGGRFTIEGEFVKENTMSEDLREKLLRGGVPGPLLERFMGKEIIA